MKAFIRWWAGFLEQDTKQSSTRFGAIAYTAASIHYALGPTPDPVILGELLGAAALFAGLRKSTKAEPNE